MRELAAGACARSSAGAPDACAVAALTGSCACACACADACAPVAGTGSFDAAGPGADRGRAACAGSHVGAARGATCDGLGRG